MPAIERFAGMARSYRDTLAFYHLGWRFAMFVSCRQIYLVKNIFKARIHAGFFIAPIGWLPVEC
ncbi:MAG: hypothetical protein PHD65_11055 [Gallionella sp.]|nr:hypothetical protein [Gallionella sp.]